MLRQVNPALSVLALIAVLWFLPGAEIALAASIVCLEDPAEMSNCRYIWIAGEIEPRDGDRLERILAKHADTVSEVYLSSPGGDVREAMKMGRLIRENALRATAPTADYCGIGKLDAPGRPLCDDCVCASACFLLWAASVAPRGGDKIGIHRPAAYAGRIGRAVAAYRKMSVIPQLLQVLNEVRAYLSEMGVPPSYVDLMTRAATHEMHWLTPSQADSLRIPSYGHSLLPAQKP